MLKGKTIVVGVCGGIAAYKVVDVVSRLRKQHAQVHVIMTEHATRFVAPLTFQSLSNNPVVTDMFAEPKTWDVEHISLARKADMMLVAPATANIIGKVANGIADDMLSTVIMATTAPVLFVPAMNYAMYENLVVQENISKLERFGYRFMEPDTGVMAAEGESGKGRLPEPEKIVQEVLKTVTVDQDLKGRRILITAGPTREPMDPVRYISNHSSGKMGYALAEAAAGRGAAVTLVSGPVNIQKPENVSTVDVTTADDMLEAVLARQADQDIFIMVAAVADYKCASIADKKIKKTQDRFTVEMVKNPDIAKEIGKIKGNRILVGFSAETNDLESNARSKLDSKNLDMIVANDVTQEGAGFGTDTNIVKIIRKDGTINEFPIMSKLDVAREILDEINKLMVNG
ncbi:MAG: bifunctional phosphopantothenoylcysteine decarboxylase/phosphopantothenate--cysteine ligase CoaBC [Clostridia bacterium]|nr:bifunctional phosphopantothenoylcysteine decarboxylase/phosphopantothenate--cysteine ligase CoaBC [Clostridia bacterium]